MYLFARPKDWVSSKFLGLMLQSTLVLLAFSVLPCLITLYLDVRESRVFRIRRDPSDLQCGIRILRNIRYWALACKQAEDNWYR